MILKQYYLGCLAHASYLLGDEATSTAIIVDPQRDIHQYLVDAGKFGLEIRHLARLGSSLGAHRSRPINQSLKSLLCPHVCITIAHEPATRVVI